VKRRREGGAVAIERKRTLKRVGNGVEMKVIERVRSADPNQERRAKKPQVGSTITALRRAETQSEGINVCV